jgi:acyl carrier protein
MTSNTILELISEALEVEIKNENIQLDSLQEYDSMGILNIMEIFEQHQIDLFPEDFNEVHQVSELVKIVQNKIN